MMIVRQAISRQSLRGLPSLQSRQTLRRLATASGPQGTASEDVSAFDSEDGPLSSLHPAPPKPDSQVIGYLNRLEHKTQTDHLGTSITNVYKPHTLLHDPPSPSQITLELLLASQAHLGHATGLWNPANSQYIFGVRQGIHVISLEATAAHLRRACKVIESVAYRAGIILFVGNRPGQDTTVVAAAKRAGACHLFQRWISGTITNRQQILGRLRTKVVDQNDQEMPEYKPQLKERAALKPDLVVCLNPLENYVLLHECGTNGIPTIGIIDTDANPTWVTYPIPANDDSLRCVQVIAGALSKAAEDGRNKRLEAAKNGIITFSPSKDLKHPDSLDTLDEEDTDDAESKDTNVLPSVAEKL